MIRENKQELILWSIKSENTALWKMKKKNITIIFIYRAILFIAGSLKSSLK